MALIHSQVISQIHTQSFWLDNPPRSEHPLPHLHATMLHFLPLCCERSLDMLQAQSQSFPGIHKGLMLAPQLPTLPWI